MIDKILHHTKKSPSTFEVLRHLLQLLSVKVTDRVLKQLLSEQKYKNSIRSIKETLKDLNIESKIYKLEYSDLEKTAGPVLAHIDYGTLAFIVITSVKKDSISYFDSVKGYNAVNKPYHQMRLNTTTLLCC